MTTFCAARGPLIRPKHGAAAGPSFVGASSPYISGSASTVHTFSCTAGVSGSNRKLFVATARQKDTGDITGVTYNGQALTKAIDQVDTTPSPDTYVELWYVDHGSMPIDGSAHNIVVSCSVSCDLIAIALEYKDVKQGAAHTSVVVAETGSGGGLHTANLTNVPADAIILGIGVNGSGSAYDSITGQTERCDAAGTSEVFTLHVTEKVSLGGADGISANPPSGTSLLAAAGWGPPA